MKQLFEIKSWLNGKVLFSVETESFKMAVELAIKANANLRYADLSSADLSYADLSYADLRSADLRYANLSYADLRYANLSYADLRSADLRSADLRYADLSDIKEDYFRVLTIAKNEVIELYKCIMDGKIDGSQYSGECACLKGTIANARHIKPEDLKDLRCDSDEPSERFFMGINEGDTPQSNPVSRIVKDWTEEFAKSNNIQLPTRNVTWT